MTFQVQQKRTLDKDRRPSPKDLLDGQLAVNVNQESPGLFFRDGSGELVKAGPVHVGPSQPVLVNHPRFSIGELWYDTGSQSLKVRTEVGWDTAGTFLADAERLVGSVTNPAGSYLLYYDFSAAQTKLYDLTQLAGALTLENIGGFAAYKTTTEIRFAGFDASILELGQLREALKTTLEARIATNDGLIATLLSGVASNAAAITLARSDFETADTLSGTRIAALELTSNSLVDRVTVLEAGGLVTSEYVDNKIAGLLDGAPAALDTLNELAAALNDDPNTISALTTQINNVQIDVNQNEADSDAADTALSDRLDVLEADPTTQTLLSAEATARTNADNALSGRIDTLEADPTTATALAAVQADVDQNETDSDAADAALSGRIDVLEADPTTATALAAVQADVDQNETDSDAADAALSGRLDTLEADPTTATALAAVQADVDQNEADSDAADTALSDRIAVFESDPGPNGATFTELDTNVDDLITLSGVSENSTHLGAFSGTTIADDQTVKAAIQALETAVESAGAGTTPPVLVEVHNNTGVTLIKGAPVYVSGEHASGIPLVELADADGASSYPAIGLVKDDIDHLADGFVVISGRLNALDTDSPGWNAGDALYLDTTAGDLTTTRPTANGVKVQKVALVVRRDSTAGTVIVMGAGRTNDVPNELTTLLGTSLNDSDLGTFTGSIITDNTSVKVGLQELETEVETKADLDGVNVPGPYNNDNDAGTNGVPVGGLYKNSNGTVHWRVS